MRRRRGKPKAAELVALPWWLNLVFAALVYVIARHVLPQLAPASPIAHALFTVTAPAVAIPLAILFSVPALVSALRGVWLGRMLARGTDAPSIAALSWREFEALVGEAYRRRGHRVGEQLEGGPDGGVDLVLDKDGRRMLVQCKHWRSRSVGVATVRELHGVVAAERADGGIVACSGGFTSEARRFARGKALELLDGADVERLVANARGQGRDAPLAARQPDSACPQCGAPLVRRVARRGRRRGTRFLGCSRFPACRGARSV